MTVRASLLLALLLAATGRAAVAQDVPFPAREFAYNDSLARAMIAYDACAWRATDTLIATLDSATRARLGPEWFCFRLDGRWHAAFGRLDPAGERYDLAAHFELTPGHVSRSTSAVDSGRLASRARAMHNAGTRMPAALSASGITFNAYVLAGADSSLVVWFLPAWQKSGVAVFGAELSFTFDPSGRELREQHVVPGPLRGFVPDSTIAFRVDSDADSAPRVGDLFFYYLTRHAFRSLRIQTRHFSSSIVKTDEGEVWVHVVREPSAER